MRRNEDVDCCFWAWSRLFFFLSSNAWSLPREFTLTNRRCSSRSEGVHVAPKSPIGPPLRHLTFSFSYWSISATSPQNNRVLPSPRQKEKKIPTHDHDSLPSPLGLRPRARPHRHLRLPFPFLSLSTSLLSMWWRTGRARPQLPTRRMAAAVLLPPEVFALQPPRRPPAAAVPMVTPTGRAPVNPLLHHLPPPFPSLFLAPRRRQQ